MLLVSANKGDAFMATWPGFVCQALSLATAETILPAVVTREFDGREDFELRSGPFFRYRSVLPPPVPFRGPEGAGEFWRLVELFVKYVDVEGFKPGALFEELDGIRRGARGSFETACLTLGIGVESIARLLLSGESPSRVCPDQLRGLLEHLDTWPGDADIRERAKNAASRLAETRPVDLMHAWARRTGVPEKLVNGWKKLRDRKAHGSALDDKEGWSLYCSAAELVYRIVASAIGYDGPITKLSEPGWGLEPGARTSKTGE